MHCKMPLTTPKCSLYAKTLKNTQAPICSTFGPFPDETLMSSIDRVLFLFGGRRVQNYFNLEHSPKQKDTCSMEKQAKHEVLHTCGNKKSYVKESPTYSVVQKSKIQKSDLSSEKTISFREPSLCDYSNTSRSSIKEDSCKQENGKVGMSLRALRRSFSLCSLACRKLKAKLTVPQSTTTSRSLAPPNWLWTKVENYTDGCQVYEVFKNSSVTAHPTKFDTSTASKIIFVIFPTGVIMPFETLPRH